MREGGNSSYQADSCSSSSAQLLFSPTPLSFTNGTCGAICWVSAAFFILHEAAVLCPPVYITQAGGGVLAVAHITCATPPNVEWRLHCSTDSAIAGRFKFRSHYSYWKAIFIPNVPNSESCLYSIYLRRKKSYSCFWKTIFCHLSYPQLQRILEKLGNHFNLNRQEKCLLVGRRWVILIQ